MASLTIDLTGLEGLAPRFQGDKPYTTSAPHKRHMGKPGQMAEGVYNPIAELGYMRPANNTTKAVTGTTNFLITSGLVVPARITEASTDAIFFADEATTGTTGKIMNLDTAVDTSLDQAYELPTFGATHYAKSEDFIIYSINTQPFIYFTRTNTTSAGASTAVGTATMSFGSPDEDWSINVPTGAADSMGAGEDSRLVFVLADNGFLYVLDGRRVHKIDGGDTGGTNGTITFQVLRFIAATVCVDAVDLRSRMWIGLHILADFDVRRNSIAGKAIPQFVGVYVWDRRAAVASMQDFIPIPGVRELKSMHTFQGRPACFTVSVEGYTQFRVWDGNAFSVVQELGSDAFPPYRRHSVYEDGERIIWLGNDGKVYCYGRAANGTSNALYIIGDMTSHVTGGQTFSSSGILLAANATETVTSGNATSPLAFYVSFLDTGGNHLKKWYPFSTETVASVAQVGHVGNVYSLVTYLPTMSTLTGIDIICQPNGSSGSSTTVATLKFYANQSATPFATKTVTRDDISKGYIQYEFNKPYVTAFQMEIEWDTSQTLGANDFAPSFATLEYEPTRTKKGES